MEKTVLIIIFTFFYVTSFGQDIDGNTAFIEFTYPMVIKKKQYAETTLTNYEVYGYDNFTKVGEKIKIHYSLIAHPEFQQSGETDEFLSFRFYVRGNFDYGLPSDIFITNNRKDTMCISMTESEFIENKGFIDTVTFVNGKFKLAEIKEIKKNKERFILAINSRKSIREFSNIYPYSTQTTQIQFLPDNKLVFWPKLYSTPFGFEQFTRASNKVIFDTLNYRISNDSIYLRSSFSKSFLSKQNVWIKSYPTWGVSQNYVWNSRIAKKQEQKLRKENDTLNLNVKIEPLLYRNVLNGNLSIYIKDSLVFSSDNYKAPEYKLQFIDNYIKSSSDSVLVKVKYSYSCFGNKTISVMNEFVVSGWGKFYLNVGVNYENDYAQALFNFLILRGNRLYFDGNIFNLEHGILPETGYYLLN